MRCLVCSSSVDPFHTFSKKALFNKAVSTRGLGTTVGMSLAYCSRCHHISSETEQKLASSELHETIYKDLYTGHSPSEISPSQRDYTNSLAKWLTSTLPTPGRVLEVGCHDGFFLHLLKEKGWECEGIEPSPHADTARQKYGLDVQQEFFKSGMYEPKSYDLVIARHVVEHVPEPSEFVAALGELVKPGGNLYIEVPNSYISLQENIYLEFHVDHISYFTPASLLFAVSSLGSFEPIHYETSYAYVRFPFIHGLFRRNDLTNYKVSSHWMTTHSMKEGIRRFCEGYKILEANLQALSRKRLGLWGSGSVATQFAVDGGWSDERVWVVDPAEVNQGKFLSVTGLEVHSPSTLSERDLDYVILATGWESDAYKQAVSCFGNQYQLLGPTDLSRSLI